MGSLYKQYMRLLEKWPVDKSGSPNLRDQILKEVQAAFPKGERSKVEDVEKCKRYLASLNRLANNYYKNKYPTKLTKTVTGLTPEQCQIAMSQEYRDYIEQKNRSIFSKLAQIIKDTFTSSKKSSM